MHRLTRPRIFAAFTLSVFALAFGLWHFTPRGPDSSVPVRLCLSPTARNALLFLAQDLGYFEQEGLAVSVRLEERGVDCLQDLLSEQSDLAATDVQPVVGALMLGHRVTILSELNSSRSYSAVLTPREVIQDPELARSRTIILSQGSGLSLLRLHLRSLGHDLSEYNLRRVAGGRQVVRELLANRGSIAVLAEPQLSKLLDSHTLDGYEAVYSPFYTQFSVLVAGEQITGRHPEALDRMVRALWRAQARLEADPTSARAKVASRLGENGLETRPSSWDKVHPAVRLSSVLVEMMAQTEIALAMHGNVIGEAPSHDLTRFLYPSSLRQLNPRLVSYE